MSKTAFVIVVAIVVSVMLYRRGLSRKKIRIEAEIEAEIMAANALPKRGVERYNPSQYDKSVNSVSEVLTSDQPVRVSASITREAFDALPVAKVVNIETGQEVGWGPRAPARVQPTRDEVAAMMPVVHSSPTAVRGNYRSAL